MDRVGAGVNDPPDAEALQRCLHDVFGLLALPALWSGRDSASILQTLIESIESLVPLEFAYAAARAGPRDAAPLQLRCRGTVADPGASPWQERLKACGAGETTPGTGTIPIDGNSRSSLLAPPARVLRGARRAGDRRRPRRLPDGE